MVRQAQPGEVAAEIEQNRGIGFAARARPTCCRWSVRLLVGRAWMIALDRYVAVGDCRQVEPLAEQVTVPQHLQVAGGEIQDVLAADMRAGCKRRCGPPGCRLRRNSSTIICECSTETANPMVRFPAHYPPPLGHAIGDDGLALHYLVDLVLDVIPGERVDFRSGLGRDGAWPDSRSGTRSRSARPRAGPGPCAGSGCRAPRQTAAGGCGKAQHLAAVRLDCHQTRKTGS